MNARLPVSCIFIDTNLLVYAYDRSEPEKQRIARDLLHQLATMGRGIISTQILAEFFVAVTSKIAQPLSIPEAYDRVQNYLLSWRILDVTAPIVLEAARGVRDHSFSFWDAQIWATAKAYQTPVIFSEDFSDGSVIEGIRFVNPFSPGFEMSDWGL